MPTARYVVAAADYEDDDDDEAIVERWPITLSFWSTHPQPIGDLIFCWIYSISHCFDRNWTTLDAFPRLPNDSICYLMKNYIQIYYVIN